MPTKIEWCDETINPQIGCWPVSEGCENCYAAKMAWRLQSMNTRGYTGVAMKHGWSGLVNHIFKEWDKPLRWNKPKRIFVGSMTDLFINGYEESLTNMDRLCDLAVKCPQHTFITLTKRSWEMGTSYFMNMFKGVIPPDNIWFGVTVELQNHCGRIWDMLQMQRKINVISCEPLLGPIDLPEKALGPNTWVICGAETGPRARPCNPDWVRSLRSQCIASGSHFFFKKFANGDTTIDGIEWHQFPSYVP